MTQQNLPSYLQQYQAPDVGAALSANLGSAMPPHVSIADNRFVLIDAGNNEIPVPTFDPQIGVYLDAAIIDVNSVMSRIYFAGNFDKNADGVRPDCFSDNGVGPSVSANSPQAPTCAICPRAEWTKINANGKKVPWCSQKQKIALLIPGFSTLFLLAVPPNSHPLLREYVELCKGNGTNMADLVTRIWFVSQGTLGFRPLSYIDEPTAQLRQAAYAEKKTDMLVGRNDVARPAGAIAAPAQAQIAPTVQAVQPNFNAGTGTLMPPQVQPGQGTTGWPAPQAQQPAQQTTQWPPQAHQQVQQPGPFVNQPNVQDAAFPSQQATLPASAGTAPTEPAPTGRRRRRTAAEMQAAQQPAQGPNGTGAPAGSPQAPFPVVQTSAGPQTDMGFGTTGASPAQSGGFGIQQGQPAAANPELATMLDDFFKQG